MVESRFVLCTCNLVLRVYRNPGNKVGVRDLFRCFSGKFIYVADEVWRNVILSPEFTCCSWLYENVSRPNAAFFNNAFCTCDKEKENVWQGYEILGVAWQPKKRLRGRLGVGLLGEEPAFIVHTKHFIALWYKLTQIRKINIEFWHKPDYHCYIKHYANMFFNFFPNQYDFPNSLL